MSRILVVDDNAINLEVAASVLKTDCHEVTMASSGKEALKIAREDTIDLILLDVNMPVMDGFEVCRKLMEIESTANIPIIFLTAYRKDEDSVVRGLELGANDYITKPIKNSELLARVRVMLRIKTAEDRIRAQNRELEDANEKLREADRLKSEFVSVVSHDLGSPLTIIKGTLELLRTGMLGPLSPRQVDKLKVIFDTTTRLDKLRRDTLDLARMDVGKLKIEKQWIGLRKLITESVSDMDIMASDKKQQLTLHPMPEIRFYCDPDLMRQVLDNLLSNAVRYTPENGIIEVNVREMPGEDGGKSVYMEVKDNGRGIPPDETEKIFERFYRTGTKIKGSTGLGLAILKGIVESHGGKVWCESDGKNGSSFKAIIPNQ